MVLGETGVRTILVLVPILVTVLVLVLSRNQFRQASADFHIGELHTSNSSRVDNRLLPFGILSSPYTPKGLPWSPPLILLRRPESFSRHLDLHDFGFVSGCDTYLNPRLKDPYCNHPNLQPAAVVSKNIPPMVSVWYSRVYSENTVLVVFNTLNPTP